MKNMTIHDAISAIDARYPNAMPKPTKVQYLSRLDHLIAKNVMKTAFGGYTEETPGDTELLAGEPYADIYVFWLQAWIDYRNGEYDKYNTAITMYQSVFDAYAKEYISAHGSADTPQLKFY